MHSSRLPLPAPREAHVWRARLLHSAAPDWRAILSCEELARADRFRVSDDRERFARTRALLRLLLGRYLDLTPQHLSLSYGHFGKPHLDCANGPCLHFNVSHSGEHALLIFGLIPKLGIDIEDLRIERDILGLARSVLSQSEHDSLLMTSDENARKREFLKAWTVREAIGKALGVGLSLSDQTYRQARADASEWSIHEIAVSADYVGAMAAHFPNLKIRLWDYPT